ncbi:MAG TPA: hypothetical protein PK177_04905 [Burkholderiaceae bacterium]|nr:hypothetical protein [Burkholderiaceae bacterium]
MSASTRSLIDGYKVDAFVRLTGYRPWDSRDRHRRQVSTFARASDTAVTWFAERARHWPGAYREARWRSLAHRLAAYSYGHF